MKVAIYRTEHFNASHRLLNPEWDQQKNESVFGKCAWPNYHGHNYEVRIKVAGETNPETGFVMDLKELSDIIVREIVEAFDHKNFNMDVPEFKSLNPSAENIAVVIYNKLRPFINQNLALQVRLYETDKNFVEYPIS